jgi:para-nitrobenzyl esterase
VSYRLGFDGFGWIEGAPANRGVLDWLMALEWVQANIAAFGGDPRQVTIAGQSAGGGAVLTLLGMEGAQHLFARAFSLSGALGDVPVADARRRAGRLAELAGVPPTLEGFRSVDEARLLLVQRELGSGNRPEDGPADLLAALAVTNDGLPFGPMVDGELIRRSTLESLRAGVGADKPLVAGAADDEIDLVSPDVAGRVVAIPPRSLLSRLGLTDVAVDDYLATHDGWTSAELLQAFLNDRVFRVDALAAARVRRPRTTWLYRYAWRSTVFGLAIHCIDVPFWFDCLDAERVEALTGPNPPQSLADRTHGAAVAFIRDGDPGWPAYTEERGAVQVFDEPPRVVDDGYRDVRPLLPS